LMFIDETQVCICTNEQKY